MTSEALPIGQIITVLIFLASLLAALYFVRRHGTGLRQHFTAARGRKSSANCPWGRKNACASFRSTIANM